MSVTGRQLLHQAGDLGEITAACVRVDEYVGVVPLENLDGWLGRMTFYDDFADPQWTGNPVPHGHEYRFQVRTASRIWFISEYDGIARLDWVPLTAAEWQRVIAMFEERLIDIATGRTWRFGKETDQ